jgi:hypothetical protein
VGVYDRQMIRFTLKDKKLKKPKKKENEDRSTQNNKLNKQTNGGRNVEGTDC